MKFRKAKQDDKEEILALYQSLIGTPYCAWGNGYPGEQEFDYDMKRNALFCMENEQGACGRPVHHSVFINTYV